MRKQNIWEMLGKILAVVGVIALVLLVIFSERAEQQEKLSDKPGITATAAPTVTVALTATAVPTVTVAPTATPVPMVTITPTEAPEENGTIVLPFVPAT